MKPLARIVVCVLVSTAIGHSQAVGKQPQLLVVRQPTVVAFFPPMTQAEADSGPDDAEALSDFNYYAYKVEKRLRSAGIAFHVVNVRSFRIRIGANVRTVQTGKIGIGYYFIAPGKKPHVEYGVMTDEDIFDATRKYFGIKIR